MLGHNQSNQVGDHPPSVDRQKKIQMRSYFEKVVQNFELKMVGGVSKNHQLTPLVVPNHNDPNI